MDCKSWTKFCDLFLSEFVYLVFELREVIVIYMTRLGKEILKKNNKKKNMNINFEKKSGFFSHEMLIFIYFFKI